MLMLGSHPRSTYKCSSHNNQIITLKLMHLLQIRLRVVNIVHQFLSYITTKRIHLKFLIKLTYSACNNRMNNLRILVINYCKLCAMQNGFGGQTSFASAWRNSSCNTFEQRIIVVTRNVCKRTINRALNVLEDLFKCNYP